MPLPLIDEDPLHIPGDDVLSDHGIRCNLQFDPIDVLIALVPGNGVAV